MSWNEVRERLIVLIAASEGLAYLVRKQNPYEPALKDFEKALQGVLSVKEELPIPARTY